MSETVSSGIGTAAIGACAALAGVVVGIGYAAYRLAGWLSAQAQEEMERLERESAAPMSHATTKEARGDFERRFALFKKRAQANPVLSPHADVVARLLAAKHSNLGAFLTESQWRGIADPNLPRQRLDAFLDGAGMMLTQANAAFIAKSVIEAARRAGFTTERSRRHRIGDHTVVMEDSEGRAVIAKIRAGDDGANLVLDLTGFGDGSCHPVMDALVQGLADRNIRLDQIRRRSHYQREGSLAMPDRTLREPSLPSQKSHPSADEHREALRRRNHRHPTTLKNGVR